MDFMTSIKEISKFNEIKTVLEKADQTTLVLFDVDYVLTQPKDPALQMQPIKAYKEKWKALLGNLTGLESNILSTLVALDGTPMLIEEGVSHILKALQEKQVKTIALTGILTGEMEGIAIQGRRLQVLKSLGIDFTSSFPQLPKKMFLSFPAYRGSYPSWNEGVLFSNGDASHKEKGKVLKAFLEFTKEKIGWGPQSIIFIDDRGYNLQDVEAMCAFFNPPLAFRGFLYKGAQTFLSPHVEEEVFINKWQALISKAKDIAKRRVHD